ncbi:MAG: phosphate ABC transporter permease PstA [bacterium]|nr:phosphate ABC transporter permease PstA [bacterium]
MHLRTRHVLNRAFTGLGYVATSIMAGALLVLLVPIFVRGAGAIVFRGTVEFRRYLFEQEGRGDREAVHNEIAHARAARAPVYAMLAEAEKEIATAPLTRQRELRSALAELRDAIRELLGPDPGQRTPVLLRQQYGQTRWDRALVKLHEVLYTETWDYSDPSGMGRKVYVPRAEAFTGLGVTALFPYVETHLSAMLRPRLTLYWGFLTDDSRDAHFFGGIMPELLGTFYLTVGAMLIAIPLGVLTAIYLAEYAGDNMAVRFLRSCMSTLAGVPSIVFGLFGLAFFINTLHVSHSKSVLAGSLTLALLVLPTVIRASEEAIRAVPHTYREAALSLGASTWRTVCTVVLPAALPGILTGIVISMGRAAGETAPIIFTAAVSVGVPLKLWEVFNHPTPALSWNIYNVSTEHEAVDEIRHVQFGMVCVLVGLVLLLNLTAIMLRARIARKLKG